MSAARSTPRPRTEGTSYTARVLGEDVGLALDVIGDILTDSVFDAGELAREKGVILQEYAAVEDTPDDVVYDAFMEAAFPDQPIGRPILGTARDDPELRRGRRSAPISPANTRRTASSWPPPAPSTTRRSWRRPSAISAPCRAKAGARRRCRAPMAAASGGCRASSNRPTS